MRGVELAQYFCLFQAGESEQAGPASYPAPHQPAIAGARYKDIAQSDSDIQRLQAYAGPPGSGPEAWLACPRQTAGRTKSVGERGISTTRSFHGPESLERISSLSRIDSHEDQYGRDQGLFAIIETIPSRQHRMSPQASLRGTRCSPKIIHNETWNPKLGDSFSDSEQEEGLGWRRRNQERRHSFKATRSKRIDMDGYEPEEVSVCGTLNSSQSSMTEDVPKLVHSRTEDWDMLHSIGQEYRSQERRRLSSVSVL